MVEASDALPLAMPRSNAIASAVRTVTIEGQALGELARCLTDTTLNERFEKAVGLMMTARGRVITSGMGKSGLIARKIAATLASTGTPAFFIHPADAGHGDLGMIANDDVMVVLSWSGETAELSAIVSYCRRFAVPLIAVTAGSTSSLARESDCALVLPRVREACPNELTPTSSTTMQLALGDALAIALLSMRGFSPEDFHVFHPQGQLGSRLVSVGDIMTTGEQVPRVGPTATILEAMLEMTGKRFGVTAVVDDAGRIIGAFTDGDLRRSMGVADPGAPVSAFMSLAPFHIMSTMLASEALALMNQRTITQIFITEHDKVIGILHLHDILRANVV